MSENYFAELSAINVNTYVEKKNGPSYVSWPFAWGEVKKLHPDATYTIYENADGLFYHTDGRTCWVKTGVTVNGVEHIEYLPVMDFKNRSIPVEQVTSFDVNKAIQRSLTKAVARHGLGLYIYAGEDLPETESEVQEAKPVPAPKCADCGGMLYPVKKRDGEMWSVNDMADYSRRRFDRILCADCQKKAFKMEKLEEQAKVINNDGAGDRL